PSGK
ncbi:hypothetical protein D043_1953B, partial [Vibrio parahaemolyticus EKP-021]